MPELPERRRNSDQQVALVRGAGTVPQKCSVLSKQLVGLAGTICLYCTGEVFQNGGAGKHSTYCPSLIAFLHEDADMRAGGLPHMMESFWSWRGCLLVCNLYNLQGVCTCWHCRSHSVIDG